VLIYFQKSHTSKQSEVTRKPPTTEETDSLKLKKAWELAIAPAKQLPMNAIGMTPQFRMISVDLIWSLGMYMSGNSLQIFSIMMVFMLFKNPITAILNIQRTFIPFETAGNKDQMLLVKLVFVATNGLLLALGIWKVNGMGLLP
jgi:ER membrane protein complex subunit 4